MTNAYRHAIDAALAGRALDPLWVEETEKVSHRPYSTGFYYGYPGQHYSSASYTTDADVMAIVDCCDEQGNAVLIQRGKFCKGDRLELLLPDKGPVSFTAAHIFNAEGEEIEDTRHPAMVFQMKLPVCAPKFAVLRKIR